MSVIFESDIPRGYRIEYLNDDEVVVEQDLLVEMFAYLEDRSAGNAYIWDRLVDYIGE